VLLVLYVLVGALPAFGADPTGGPSASPVLVAQTSPEPGASEPAPSAAPDASPGAAPGAPGAPGASPAGSPSSTPPCPHPQPHPTAPAAGATPRPLPLCPAELSGNPLDMLAWAFTPIFQALFLGLAGFYALTGDIGIAIILLTLVIKTLLIPLFRAQIVSQRRMQLLQPEIKAIQQKFKGQRQKISEETMRLYRERGINPAAGCLPAVLQLFLLIPIYQVVSQGLSAPDISSMLQVFGQPVLDIACQSPGNPDLPCINTTISWLGGLDAHRPQISFTIPGIGFQVSGVAVIAALLQLVQTRMMVPNTNDPQTRNQQRIFLFLPLISIFYGWFLPAGLFIYWIVFTAYSIVQQYLIAGWGSLFPLFGWMPEFAKNHEPRFPVSTKPLAPAAGTEQASKAEPARSASDAAAGTIRPARQRARTSRRGRRR
jgi:YidC/Oxa1 family membrane protein insertase